VRQRQLRSRQPSLACALPGLNDFKRTGYSGPCPPIRRHRHFHKLYALDSAAAGCSTAGGALPCCTPLANCSHVDAVADWLMRASRKTCWFVTSAGRRKSECDLAVDRTICLVRSPRGRKACCGGPTTVIARRWPASKATCSSDYLARHWIRVHSPSLVSSDAMKTPSNWQLHQPPLIPTPRSARR
jgi:hypothetical protein